MIGKSPAKLLQWSKPSKNTRRMRDLNEALDRLVRLERRHPGKLAAMHEKEQK